MSISPRDIPSIRAVRQAALGSNHLGQLPQPILIAHRGASSLAPENTLAAFKLAVSQGADAIELDVRLSKDLVPVIMHDATVDRTTQASGPVASFTMDELRTLNAGYRFSVPGQAATAEPVASLEEVFAALPDTYMLVELKDSNPELYRRVAQLIQRYKRQNLTLVLVFSVKRKRAKHMRRLAPDIVTGHSTAEIIRFSALLRLGTSSLFRKKAPSFEVPLKKGRLTIVTPKFVAAAHKRGIKVLVWTINDPAKMAELFEMGVDGIITDYIPLAQAVRSRSNSDSDSDSNNI
jgi:glycerophosphoryl diester phosphodiesterase